jgi:hypothetical protein
MSVRSQRHEAKWESQSARKNITERALELPSTQFTHKHTHHAHNHAASAGVSTAVSRLLKWVPINITLSLTLKPTYIPLKSTLYLQLLYTQYTYKYFIHPENLLYISLNLLLLPLKPTLFTLKTLFGREFSVWSLAWIKKIKKQARCIRPLPFSSGLAHELAHAKDHRGGTLVRAPRKRYKMLSQSGTEPSGRYPSEIRVPDTNDSYVVPT